MYNSKRSIDKSTFGTGGVSITAAKFKAALAICLLLNFAITSAQNVGLTPEQQAQLGNLSAQERNALLNGSAAATGVQQTQAADPVTVTPRSVSPAQPNERSIEEDAQERQGADSITSDTQAQSTEEEPLEQFGYELFAGSPTTFAPATNIPVPASYVMGPGDIVVIQLYGQRNLTHELAITREGMLMFPEIGPISVAGLNFEEMRAQLQNVVATQLIGQSASITLGALRSINIFVLGEAFRPGSYTVSSLSTMTNALFVSGGITRVGSLRNIRLMRSGELITELDLYDLLLRGDTSSDARLLPGDVIFIPPVGRTVGIAGEVKRPAIFELNDEETTADVLPLSGGFLPTAFPRVSRIERINPNGERTIIDVDLSDQNTDDFTISDGDVIQIFPILDQIESVVLLEGHVQRPGGFEWRQGMRVSDVVRSVSEMQPNPDLEYALIGREVQPTRRIEMIYVNLGLAINNPGSAADLELEPRDRLFTFGAAQNRQAQVADLLILLREQATYEQPPQIVTIRGNVRFPGEYPLVRNMTMDDLVKFSAGLNADTELDFALLERRIDLQGNVALEATSFDPQTLSTRSPVQLNSQDEVIIFNANEPRDALVASTLDKLRFQANTNNPALIVSVTGNVKFPGSYPLYRNLAVEDLIRIAGGLTESAETRVAEITRYDAEPEIGREIDHVAIDLRSSGSNGLGLAMQPYDQLVIRQMPNWTDNESVTIGGEVNSPGTYSITKEDTLSSLVTRAGGLTAYADARASIFLREELRQNEERMLEEVRDSLERDIITQRLQSTNFEGQGSGATGDTSALLDRISSITATGRLVIDMPSILAGTNPDKDVILRPGDQLLIPRTRQEVSVIGEVQRPTSHLFDPKASLADYVDRSGGLTELADGGNVFVIRSSGEVASYGGSRWFFQGGVGVEPGDSIVVPFDASSTDFFYIWRSVSQILFNMSTTILAIDRVAN